MALAAIGHGAHAIPSMVPNSGDPSEPCCTAQDAPCCANAACCAAVCAVDPLCCDVAWDLFCAQEAAALVVCGCVTCPPSAHNCFTTGGPGCSDEHCCVAICAQDAFCCETEWDITCVVEAGKVCDGCGDPLGGDCCGEHDTPACENRPCCLLVCEVDPSCCETAWDYICVATAFTVPVCGCPCPMGEHGCFVEGMAGCAAERCCLQVCAVDGFCCVVAWDDACIGFAGQFCEGCGDPEAGECCTAHNGPYCSNAKCCELVCFEDLFCCAITWDSFCVAEAYLYPDCSCPCPESDHDCLTAGIPGCTDTDCCEDVCFQEPLCCLIAWDDLCVSVATLICGVCGDPAGGCCFAAHDGGGCDRLGCCATVCFSSPACCEIQWDSFCAADAKAICCLGDIIENGIVNGADVGAIFSGWGGPGPSDLNCDGTTNGADLGVVLQMWGPCPADNQ